MAEMEGQGHWIRKLKVLTGFSVLILKGPKIKAGGFVQRKPYESGIKPCIQKVLGGW